MFIQSAALSRSMQMIFTFLLFNLLIFIYYDNATDLSLGGMTTYANKEAKVAVDIINSEIRMSINIKDLTKNEVISRVQRMEKMLPSSSKGFQRSLIVDESVNGKVLELVNHRINKAAIDLIEPGVYLYTPLTPNPVDIMEFLVIFTD